MCMVLVLGLPGCSSEGTEEVRELDEARSSQEEAGDNAEEEAQDTEGRDTEETGRRRDVRRCRRIIPQPGRSAV